MTRMIQDMHRAIDRNLFRPDHTAVGRVFQAPTVIYFRDTIFCAQDRPAMVRLVEEYWRCLVRRGVTGSVSRLASITPLPDNAFQSEVLVDFFDDDAELLGEGQVRFWSQITDKGPRIELVEYHELPLGLRPSDFAGSRRLH